MTQITVPNHSAENRGEIGPWGFEEVQDMICALRELAAGIEVVLDFKRQTENDAERACSPQTIGLVQAQAREVTKALGAFASAESSKVALELAEAFAIGASAEAAPQPPASSRVVGRGALESPVLCSVLSTETREKEGRMVDVALIAVAFYEPGLQGSRHEYTDAVLVRRDRENGERRLRHFEREENDFHFHRANECRLEWLGLSDGPFAPG